MVYLSHAPQDTNFVNLLEAVLRYSGVTTWRSTPGLPPGRTYQREVRAALTTADTLLVIVSTDAVRSSYVMHECDLFVELHPRGEVLPIVRDTTAPRDVRPSLEPFDPIDFNECMLKGFVRLLKVFGKAFAYQDKRRGGHGDRRVVAGDRRTPGPAHHRVRVGFWKAFQQGTGYGEFQGLPLNQGMKSKTVAALLPEARKYQYVIDGSATDPERVLREAVDQTWRAWQKEQAPDGGPVGAAYVIEDVALQVCRAYRVTAFDRRSGRERRT